MQGPITVHNDTTDRRDFLAKSAALAVLASLPSTAKADKPVLSKRGLPRELDGTGLADAIAKGEISQTDAVKMAVDASRKLHKALNAVVEDTYTEARAEAKGAKRKGPFGGVPTFIKDLSDIAGVPTRSGSRAFAKNVPETTGYEVENFLNTGMISLGKSQTPEFGLSLRSETDLTGACRNPWNLDYSAGGSSSGAGALVAAGVVPIAHASDGGGSIRFPAAFCGVVGLKPSKGRFPTRDTGVTPPHDISVHGAITRTIRDMARFTSAYEEGTHALLPPVGMVTSTPTRRLRIVWQPKTTLGEDHSPQIDREQQKVIAVLEELGHSVDVIPAFSKKVLDAFVLYWAAGAKGIIDGWEAANNSKAKTRHFEPWTLSLREMAESRASEIPAAIQMLKSYEQQALKIHQNFDLLLTPVAGDIPPKIGLVKRENSFEKTLERTIYLAQHTVFQNIAGLPAISLPLGTSDEGLPIGFQFVANYMQEKLLLQIGYELEEYYRWQDRLPPTRVEA